MPRYVFEYVRGGKGRHRTFTTSIANYDKLKEFLEERGWERRYSPPLSVHVRGGYWDYYQESVDEAKKLDKTGWPGMGDV